MPNDHQMNLVELNRAQEEADTDPFTFERYRRFGGLLPPGSIAVLDVGCHNGRGGAALKEVAPKARLYGIDIVPERVAGIPAGLYEEVHVGFLRSCDPPPEGFDAVLMGEVIEHVPWSEWDELLNDVIRVLRPGGLLLLTTPNPHYILLKWRSANSVLGGAHVSVHCARSLSQYLTYRGFDVRSLVGTGRVAEKLGHRLPLFCYGSYMLAARAPS
jgi:SAM-dependent methyltransferase